MDWQRIAEVLSANPAKILGTKKGSLSEGSDADVVIIDPARKWVFTKQEILSKSHNSPFINRRLKGKPVYTIFGGKLVYTARERV